MGCWVNLLRNVIEFPLGISPPLGYLPTSNWISYDNNFIQRVED